MNGATYNQLQIFHAIVQAGSLTQAARHLEVAPASVSQALKALEKQLGLPLFTRSTAISS
ncbi:transcriptional regulator LysR family [Photobacterium aphoticum]|uniref:Transcriptional regulator LysR family n=1 Tax=Photobacterium aphoticum TaxID=754436 RepID=A0A090R3B2_9GAMM|nr:transcriptional regulator LysR family [Photobacterium aphoticum]